MVLAVFLFFYASPLPDDLFAYNLALVLHNPILMPHIQPISPKSTLYPRNPAPPSKCKKNSLLGCLLF